MTAGPVLQSLKETLEVVSLVPTQEQNLMEHLLWGPVDSTTSGGVAEVVEDTSTLSFFSGRR